MPTFACQWCHNYKGLDYSNCYNLVPRPSPIKNSACILWNRGRPRIYTSNTFTIIIFFMIIIAWISDVTSPSMYMYGYSMKNWRYMYSRSSSQFPYLSLHASGSFTLPFDFSWRLDDATFSTSVLVPWGAVYCHLHATLDCLFVLQLHFSRQLEFFRVEFWWRQKWRDETTVHYT